MAREGSATEGVMIRPPVEVVRWYQSRAADLLKAGVRTTANKLMVEDLEALRNKDLKAKGGKK